MNKTLLAELVLPRERSERERERERKSRVFISSIIMTDMILLPVVLFVIT